MRRISSRGIFFQKRIFPLFWFGFSGFFVFVTLPVIRRGRANLMFLIMPAVMAVVGYVIMKKFLFDLADEAWDAGDALLVKFGSEEELIPFSNVMNVSYTTLVNPNRVTLTLRQPCRFGKEVSFSPPSRFVPFAKNPIIDELIQRIDDQRSR